MVSIRHSLLLAALSFCLLSPTHCAHAQQPTPPDTSEMDSPLVDSLRAALDQFEAADPPRAADSVQVRRWADSVQAKGNSIRKVQPARAHGYFGQALDAHQLLQDYSKIADLKLKSAVAYYAQSRHDEVLTNYREALKIYREIGDRLGIAKTLNGLGVFHYAQGRYDQSLARLQESLEIHREIGDRRGTAWRLNNIAQVLAVQGRLDEALPRLRESLQIVRELGNRSDVPGRLINIGNILRRQGRYEEALSQYQEALELFREAGETGKAGVSVALNNIGNVYSSQGRYEESLSHYREALEVAEEINNYRRVANTLGNIGIVHKNQGHYEEALARYRESLETERKIGDRRGIAKTLNNIGVLRREQGRLQTATDTLRRAVDLFERLRRNASSPEARRSLLATQIDAYRALTTTYVRAGEPDSALRSAERARARLLADRLASAARSDTAFTIPSVHELRQTLGPEEAALLYLNAGSDWPLAAVAVTKDTIVARELPDSTVRREIGREHRLALSRLRRQEGTMKTALREGGFNTEDDLGGPPSLPETIRLYRQQLTGVEGVSNTERDLARRFHRLLIEPMSEVLAGKDDLLLVPGGTLGYLPFETLRDSTGQYLVETRHVRYAQSLTVLRQLRQRDYGQRERPLLALGGAEYGYPPTRRGQSLLATTYRGSTKVATEEHASALQRDAGRRLNLGKSPRPSYAELGFGRWRNLPGTKEEVNRLGTIAGGRSTVITGKAASEDTVRALNESGRMAEYRRVHLATHGVSVPEAPALSALVLSQVGASDSLAAQDGYLNMQEIADLEMQADVAVLSACQTGLGRIVAGEGVVSLSHAFLRAGANATLVSQWKVLDKSTRQFMTAVYKQAKKENTSFAEAVTETKRAFIAGEHGEKNKDPLRWAPFVYYGRE